ncbi:hypothetical protein [Qaidamihabitans albus]|uniref:hypothetical protein n=1 Tax=Qaidamihabitans albus TaxID=2795733 RepID=UPI001B357ECD|nr:hypothetical protein [Qaidamihabitans albus]
MFGSRGRRLLAVAGVGVALAAAGAGVAPAAVAETAGATPTTPTLKGAWAPLNRCPVDDPAMLAADGVRTVAQCLASRSASGTMTIGATTVPTGATDLQFGVVRTGSTYTVVPPAEGAIVADPVRVPGGLLGLMCPSDIPLISGICRQVENSTLNAVTATVLPAGDPSDFDFFAGLAAGRPILSLPVKIHLENPFLGRNCHLGSDAEPIVLRPQNLTAPAAEPVRFDPEGSIDPDGAMGYFALTGADQGDDGFAIPRATGCGAFGLLNGAVNLKMGLPSPAGANSLVLDGAQTYFGGFYTPGEFAPEQGRALAEHWHAAVAG